MSLLLSNKDLAIRGRLVNITGLALRTRLVEANERSSQKLPTASSTANAQYRTSLQEFAAKCRWYLTASDGWAVYQAVRPDLLRLHSAAMFEAQVHLQLLFPPNVPESISLVPEIMTLWGTIDRCSGWDLDWMVLVTRILKGSGAQDEWAKHIPTLFARIQDSLYLSVQGTASAGSRRRPSSARNQATQGQFRHQKKAAKLAVYLFGCGDGVGGDSPDDTALSPAMQQLKKLLLATRTYFHPSNQGMQQITLGSFVEQLCRSFVKRLGVARAANVAPPAGQLRATAEVSVADRRAFVDAVLPLIEMGLYAKNRIMVGLAQSSLRHIAWVAPKKVHDRFLPAIFQALDPSNLLQAHQAVSAIKALTVVVQPLLQGRPLLAPHLTHLLRMTLPGLDPNDSLKTLATLMLFRAVLSWVPIVDGTQLGGQVPAVQAFQHNLGSAAPGRLSTAPTEAGYRYGIDEDEESAHSPDALETVRDEMWRAGPALCDWALGVLDRMFALMENALKAAKHGNAHRMESVVLFVFQDVAAKLFAQMHPSLRKQARKKVVAFLSSKQYPNAQQHARGLVSAITLSDPEESLKALLNVFQARVLDASAAKEDVIWSTAMIGACCRVAGIANLKFQNTLKKIIRSTLQHKEFDVCKEGGKLLRRVLRGLSEQYTVDNSSFTMRPDMDDQTWKSIAVNWGATVEWDQIDPKWHIPSDKEVSAAVEIFKEHYNGAWTQLRSFMKGASSSAGDSGTNMQWRRALRQLYQSIRGVRNLISDNIEEDAKLAERIVLGYPDVYEPESTSSPPSAASEEYDAENLGAESRFSKGALGSMSILLQLNHVAEFLMGNRRSDAGAHRSLIKVIITVSCRGAESDKHTSEIVWSQFAQSMTKSKAIEAELVAFARFTAASNTGQSSLVLNRADEIIPRSMMVEKATSLHHTRRYVAGVSSGHILKRLHRTKPYKKTLSTLDSLACHEWSEVRSMAKNGVDRFGIRFPFLLRDRLDRWVDRLGKPFENTSDPHALAQFSAKFAGTTQLLNSQKIARWIAYDWKQLANFLRTAIKKSKQTLESLDKEKEAECRNSVQAFFASVVGRWLSLPLKSDDDVKVFEDLVADLVQEGSTSSNWKYQLMVCASLSILLRSPESPTVNGSQQTAHHIPRREQWQLVSKLAQSDVAPVRLAATRLLDSMLCCLEQWRTALHHSPASVKTALDDAREVLHSPSLMESIMGTIAEDHKVANLKADGTEGASLQYSVGVGELVRLVRRPYGISTSRYSRTSSNVALSHAALFRSIMVVAGPGIIPLIEPVLDQFMFHSQGKEFKSRAAAAAEAAAGVMRGAGDALGDLLLGEVGSFRSAASSEASGDSDFAVLEVDAAADMVIPKLSKLADSMSASTASDWVDMVRYVADGGDPRTSSRLCEMLCDELVFVLEGTSQSDSSFTKVSNLLRLFNSIVIELGERATNARVPGIQKAAIRQMNLLGKKLVPCLLKAVDHPYRVVRGDIASTLGVLVNSFTGGLLKLRAPAHPQPLPRQVVLSSGDVRQSMRVDVAASAAVTLASGEPGSERRNRLEQQKDQREQVEGLVLDAKWCRVVTDDLLSKVQPLIESPLDSEATKDETITRIMWTLLSFAHTLLKVSDSFLYGTCMVDLLRGVAVGQGHPDQEVSKLSKNVLEICSQSFRAYVVDTEICRLEPQPVMAKDIVERVLLLGGSSSWRIRAASGKFLRAFLPQHGAIILSNCPLENRVAQAMEELLLDNMIQVQEAARDCLRSIWSSKATDSEMLKEAMARYEAKTKVKLPRIYTRAGRQSATESGKNIKEERDKAFPKFKERQAGCLAISAAVMAFPYDIASTGPEGVVLLSKFTRDPEPTGKIATEALSEFKRTHQDGWQLHKLKFTKDQLYDLDGLLVSPSYYA